jgi:hypothetical protein
VAERGSAGWRARIAPRRAGAIAIAAGVVVAVAGGALIATPPWSILGALVLVAATILLSVGAGWTLRRSWREFWPPDRTPSRRKLIRRLQVMNVVGSILLVVVIALAVVSIATQAWMQLAVAGLLCVTNLSSIALRRRLVTALLRPEAADIAAPGADGGGAG